MELRDTDVLVRYRPAQPTAAPNRSVVTECTRLPSYIKVVRRTPLQSRVLDINGESAVGNAW